MGEREIIEFGVGIGIARWQASRELVDSRISALETRES
jgi:hypothetical protein